MLMMNCGQEIDLPVRSSAESEASMVAGDGSPQGDQQAAQANQEVRDVGEEVSNQVRSNSYTVVVDFGSTSTGTVRDLFGVNNSPLVVPTHCRPHGTPKYDYTYLYQKAGGCLRRRAFHGRF
jgi:hypothetical protein